MLHLTSCLFATVVAHAYHVRAMGYHHIFLLVTVLSILFHTTKHPVVAVLDKITAHVSFFYVITDCAEAVIRGMSWLLIFPVVTSGCWFAQTFFPCQRDALHAGVHIAGVAGLHFFLALLY